MKTVKVIFSPEAEKIYKYLNSKASLSKTENMILNSLNKKNRHHKNKYPLW